MLCILLHILLYHRVFSCPLAPYISLQKWPPKNPKMDHIPKYKILSHFGANIGPFSVHLCINNHLIPAQFAAYFLQITHGGGNPRNPHKSQKICGLRNTELPHGISRGFLFEDTSEPLSAQAPTPALGCRVLRIFREQSAAASFAHASRPTGRRGVGPQLVYLLAGHGQPRLSLLNPYAGVRASRDLPWLTHI